METLFDKLATVYGPLGLGWILAIYLLIRLFRVIEVIRQNTSAINDLTTFIKAKLD